MSSGPVAAKAQQVMSALRRGSRLRCWLKREGLAAIDLSKRSRPKIQPGVPKKASNQCIKRSLWAFCGLLGQPELPKYIRLQRKTTRMRCLFWAPPFSRALKTLESRPRDGPLPASATKFCYSTMAKGQPKTRTNAPVINQQTAIWREASDVGGQCLRNRASRLHHAVFQLDNHCHSFRTPLSKSLPPSSLPAALRYRARCKRHEAHRENYGGTSGSSFARGSLRSCVEIA